MTYARGPVSSLGTQLITRRRRCRADEADRSIDSADVKRRAVCTGIVAFFCLCLAFSSNGLFTNLEKKNPAIRTQSVIIGALKQDIQFLIEVSSEQSLCVYVRCTKAIVDSNMDVCYRIV